MNPPTPLVRNRNDGFIDQPRSFMAIRFLGPRPVCYQFYDSACRSRLRSPHIPQFRPSQLAYYLPNRFGLCSAIFSQVLVGRRQCRPQLLHSCFRDELLGDEARTAIYRKTPHPHIPPYILAMRQDQCALLVQLAYPFWPSQPRPDLPHSLHQRLCDTYLTRRTTNR